MWDIPRPGLEPVSPALAGRFSTTAPPGKPLTLNKTFNVWFRSEPHSGSAIILLALWKGFLDKEYIFISLDTGNPWASCLKQVHWEMVTESSYFEECLWLPSPHNSQEFHKMNCPWILGGFISQTLLVMWVTTVFNSPYISSFGESNYYFINIGN